MADGVLKEIEDFVEKEVKVVEGDGDKKSVYSDKFQGDVLGKHDPYDEDQDDHDAHASESAVSDPDHNAEWFPAVKGAAKSKPASSSAAGGDSKDKAPGVKADDKQGADPAAAKAGTKDDSSAKGDASSSSDAGGDSKDKASDAKADGKQGADPAAAKAGTKDDGSAKGDAFSSSDAGGGDPDTAAKGQGGDASGKDTTADKDSSGDSDSKDDNSSDPKDQKGGAQSEDAASDTDGQKKESNKDSAKDSEAVDADKKDPDAEESDTQGGSADSTFDKKAPTLIADLDDLAAKGKKAKMQKETLRGVRRTIEEPHKLYKDPERLAIARSGDPDDIRHSLKRYGRSVEPKDDADPKDISSDPDKLEDIRSNPNKAIRGMIDLGQQYGKDPFDGIDPADVQDIIEHHASEHPHRKHKAPYVPPESAADDGDGGDSDDAGASATDSSATKGDDAEDSSGDDSGGDDAASPTYPKLDAAKDLDPDNPSDADGFTPKSKKTKRSYPKPYSNNEAPSDLQLACDSLNNMAADASDDDDEPSEDAPLHKKKAHAAKKMLKCLNRVRSFQQDPAACEGAFVDEASEEGAKIAGLTPDEVEQKYYSLKEVSIRYKKNRNPEPADTDDDDDDSADYTRSAGDDHDGSGDDDRDDSDDGTKSVEETGNNSNVLINKGDESEEDETPDIEMSLPANQFPDTGVNASTEDPDADSSAETTASDPISQISGMLSGVLGNPDVSAIAGDVANVEGAAESIEGAVDNMKQVEGELSEVEALGSKASSASSKIKGLKGAKSNYSKMINLCSNPIDNVTEAENALSGVKDLAQHPDAVINKAESLINAGQAGISALAQAKSPLDALNAIGGVAAQLNGGGSSDDSDDDDSADNGDSDDSDDTDSSIASGGSDDDDGEDAPSEFANAGKYGDD